MSERWDGSKWVRVESEVAPQLPHMPDAWWAEWVADLEADERLEFEAEQIAVLLVKATGC